MQELKFIQSLPKVTEKDNEEKFTDRSRENLAELVCKTNRLAYITWKECYYHSDDIYDPLNYASCEELFAANTCENIPYGKDWFNFNFTTEFKSLLMYFVSVPKAGGCIGCFASSGNETIQSFTKYSFKGDFYLSFQWTVNSNRMISIFFMYKWKTLIFLQSYLKINILYISVFVELLPHNLQSGKKSQSLRDRTRTILFHEVSSYRPSLHAQCSWLLLSVQKSKTFNVYFFNY